MSGQIGTQHGGKKAYLLLQHAHQIQLLLFLKQCLGNKVVMHYEDKPCICHHPDQIIPPYWCTFHREHLRNLHRRNCCLDIRTSFHIRSIFRCYQNRARYYSFLWVSWWWCFYHTLHCLGISDKKHPDPCWAQLNSLLLPSGRSLWRRRRTRCCFSCC